MRTTQWEWVSAKATGTSHLRSQRGCDDFGACFFVRGKSESALVAVVSDGAGSAKLSSIGSRIATQSFCQNAHKFLLEGGNVASLSRQTAGDWLDDIRDRVGKAANAACATRRDYAATLIGCLISENQATIVHVGDGSAVCRLQNSDEWIVASWPSHGEYAATTYFVTDDPEPTFVVRRVDGPVAELAMFTDGIEHLVLDFSAQVAFAPFFNRMFAGFQSGGRGRNRTLSRHLRSYLESPAVCEKTDDDKTLLLARRLSEDVTT
jgi:hypothetical protein